METLDFGLHDILIYEMRNGEGKGRKYLEKKKTEKETFCIFILHHQGVLETVAVKQLFQRLSLTLMRGNAALVMTRKPDSDLAPAEVDGII